MTDPLKHEIEVACRLAEEAAEAVRRHYSADFDVDYKDKGRSDPVTQADRDANDIIVEGLKAAFPGDAILAEESAKGPAEERMQHSRLWCVDPVDGTREFVARNGQFIVMIGLAIDGESRLGVLLQPTEDLLWYGVVGHGAFERRPGGATVPLSVSDRASSEGATMMISRGHRSKTVARIGDALQVGERYPLGSVGLKVARVASGAADIYLSTSNRTQEWDACGPEAVLRAAGGQMTDILGQPLRYNKLTTETPRGMLATNGAIHAQAVDALAAVAKDRGWD